MAADPKTAAKPAAEVKPEETAQAVAPVLVQASAAVKAAADVALAAGDVETHVTMHAIHLAVAELLAKVRHAETIVSAEAADILAKLKALL